ncbi:MAG: DUF4912 domain-containing protein [Planctomycetales bacterium]|nr:DUF4912 domain-containing protein [Planctomycetales bacterium]
MYTVTSLRAYTQKDLAQMAKRRGLRGWHSMRKDELVKALVKAAKKDASKSGGSARPKTKSSKSGAAAPRTVKAAARSVKSNGAAKGAKPTNGRVKVKSAAVLSKIQAAQAEREHRKDLAGPSAHTNGNGHAALSPRRDRVVLMVRDPYWLHVHWELSRARIERAKAALAEHWHTAKPTLRLYEVDNDTTTSTSARVARDIEIHGGVQNWYIDVNNPPQGYLVEVGYRAANGQFHCLARSNRVSTPRPGAAGGADANWSDVAANCEKIFALSGGYSTETHSGELQQLFEERLNRPMGTPMSTRYGAGAERYLGLARNFELQVEAEMILFGKTDPRAHLMMGGEPVAIDGDGRFSVRMDLGNQRQVIPVVAESVDGVEQRTIVIAVERNTKVMEPVQRDPNEL